MQALASQRHVHAACRSNALQASVRSVQIPCHGVAGFNRTSNVIPSCASASTTVPLAEPAAEPLAQIASDISSEPSVSKSTEKDTSNKPTERSGKTKRAGDKRPDARNGKSDNNRNSKLSAEDRKLIQERMDALLSGEAVGLAMASTPEGLAAGFRGLKPLAAELAKQDRRLLFFPSRGSAPPPSDPASAPSDGAKPAPPLSLELALVAVPSFTAPEPAEIIRVPARDDHIRAARRLNAALLRSGSAALRAAGPAAALSAVKAAECARRFLLADQQVDLAFSIEYITVPYAKSPTAAGAGEGEGSAAAAVVEGQAVEGAAAASAPAAEAAAAEGTAAGENGSAAAPAQATTSVLQFTFYKRVMPVPEVLVSDYAPTRSGQQLSLLLTALLGERREVDLRLNSRDALFAARALEAAVRGCFVQHKASVAAFVTSLEMEQPSEETSAASAAAAATSAQHFDCTLQLRRLPGLPCFAATGASSSAARAQGRGRRDSRAGDADSLGAPGGRSPLGAPVGVVKWNTQLGPLASAIKQELNFGGTYSLLPEEGRCVATVLRAAWEAQQARAAAAARQAAKQADAAAAASADFAAAAQIAIVPESQTAGLMGGFSGPGAEGERAPRATVMHLLEVTPPLAAVLSKQERQVLAVSGGEQLMQLAKGVALRNRMYGNRPNGKLLTMRPFLDAAGALQMRLEFLPTTLMQGQPAPPGEEPQAAASSSSSARNPEEMPCNIADLGAETDDEYGFSGEAAAMPCVAAAVPTGEKPEGEGAAEKGGKAAVKSPWKLFVGRDSKTTNLALSIAEEACKPYHRDVPVWLRLASTDPEVAAAAGLAVAMAQAQVAERGGGARLLVLPTTERKRRSRDGNSRPYNEITWKVIKAAPEPGAELEAAPAPAVAEVAAAAPAPAAAEGDKKQQRRGPRRTFEQAGPSPAAMAAAAAAAAKAIAAMGEQAAAGDTARRMW